MGIVAAIYLSPRQAWPVLATLMLAVIGPTALLLFLGVRSGRWRDVDVSVREERKRFYPWAIPISGFGVVMMWLIHAPSFILRGGLVTLGVFVIAALINTGLKISLHSIFATYCAVVLFGIGPVAGAVALLLASLVFWARLFLKRHTVPEVVAGIGLGAVAGILAAWWP